jgi:hypothetical protein
MHIVTRKRMIATITTILCVSLDTASSWPSQDPLAGPPVEESASYQPPQRGGQSLGRMYKDGITPHWFRDDARFWYRNDLRGGTTEFVLVDAERGTRAPAFDHERLAAALSKANGKKYRATRLPFDSIEFSDDDAAIRFAVGGTTFRCDLNSYECSKTDAGTTKPQSGQSAEKAAADEGARRGTGQRRGFPQGPGQRSGQFGAPLDPSPRSPDGKWTAFVKDHNVFIRSAGDEREIQLSEDGKAGGAYGMLQWAPDSISLAAFRIEPGERHEVYLIESSPREGGRAKLTTRPYASRTSTRRTSSGLRRP